MKSMKMSKKDQEKHDGPIGVGDYERDQYPYGLRIDLDKESLDKLGVKAEDFKAGTTGTITAKCEIITVITTAGKTHGNDSVELQITDMEINGGKKKGKTAAYHEAMDSGPGEGEGESY